jgi:uncharacterized protein (TIGR00266 family)
MQANINGTTMPVLEMLLEPGETIVTTHGDLSWMSPNVQMSQTTNTGGSGGLMAGLKRMAGGGGLFLTRYEAQGGQGMVAFAAKLPGRIFPVDISQGHGYVVHKHGWLCGTAGITPSVCLQQTFRGGLWGGEGFILQKLEGQGQAWVELSGEIATYELAQGQSLLVHPGHVGMFTDSVSFTVMRLPGIANRFFGADGHHVVNLTGPGTIWLQSMPLPVLAQSLSEYMATDDRREAVGGGLVGGVLGNVLRG